MSLQTGFALGAGGLYPGPVGSCQFGLSGVSSFLPAPGSPGPETGTDKGKSSLSRSRSRALPADSASKHPHRMKIPT